MGFSRICLEERTASHPNIETADLGRVLGGDAWTRLYSHFGPSTRPRKEYRYQFEAAYQNNGYIFINIWPNPGDPPSHDKREISMEMRVQACPEGRLKRISSRRLFRTLFKTSR